MVKMVSVFEKASKTIEDRQLAESDSAVLLLVSGGRDSVSLAYLAKSWQQEGKLSNLAMLHVNHKLRAEESDADQEFVEKLAALLDIPLFICEIDVKEIAEKCGGNIEAVARQERYLAAYEALESLCSNFSCDLSQGRIFTAHTQDDRVENFYMRSIVGTGPGGFRSMLYKNSSVVRPLLDISRQELRDYLDDLYENGNNILKADDGKFYREDATNAHTDKFRAFVRHEIIPLAKSRNQSLLDVLGRTMNLIADEDDFMEGLAKNLFDRSVTWLSAAVESGESEDGGAAQSAQAGEDASEGESKDGATACLIAPWFGKEKLPVQRRVIKLVLTEMLGSSARVEACTIEDVLQSFDIDGKPRSGYACNIAGNLAISANKHGLRIEKMESYLKRRKPNKQWSKIDLDDIEQTNFDLDIED